MVAVEGFVRNVHIEWRSQRDWLGRAPSRYETALMHQRFADIWFGPGGLSGVFGAGVAYGLQQSFSQSEIDVAKVRLFGSSVGCLNAVFAKQACT